MESFYWYASVFTGNSSGFTNIGTEPLFICPEMSVLVNTISSTAACAVKIVCVAGGRAHQTDKLLNYVSKGLRSEAQ